MALVQVVSLSLFVYARNEMDADDNVPATAETIIHALSQFHSEHTHLDDLHAVYDDENAVNNSIPGNLTEHSSLNEGANVDTTLEGLSRSDLEHEVIGFPGHINDTNGLDAVSSPPAGASRRRNTKSSTTAQDAGVIRELQVATGKRVERDRKTELYKVIRHHVSHCQRVLEIVIDWVVIGSMLIVVRCASLWVSRRSQIYYLLPLSKATRVLSQALLDRKYRIGTTVKPNPQMIGSKISLG